MKRQLNEIWKEKEGSKNVWYVQAPKGRLAFNTKKEAEAWKKATEKKTYYALDTWGGQPCGGYHEVELTAKEFEEMSKNYVYVYKTEKEAIHSDLWHLCN